MNTSSFQRLRLSRRVIVWAALGCLIVLAGWGAPSGRIGLSQSAHTLWLPIVAQRAEPVGFVFLAYGDSRAGADCAGNTVHKSLVTRMAQEPAQLAFHLGDMITGYNANTNWVTRGACPEAEGSGSFAEHVAPFEARTPAPGLSRFLYPVIGNHDDNWGSDWYPDPAGDTICSVFDLAALVPNHTRQPYFQDQTGRVPRYADEDFRSLMCSDVDSSVYPSYAYYAFDYRNARFIVMRLDNEYHDLHECYNGCDDPTNYDAYYYRHQLDWVRAELTEAADRIEIDHVFVFLHAPMFSTSDGHVSNASWQTLAQEFTDAGKVAFVFSGHNHVYERTVPVAVTTETPMGVRDDERGTIYVTTGGGGSPLHGFRAADAFAAARASEYHYVRVEVSGTQITLRAIREDGSELDVVTR